MKSLKVFLCLENANLEMVRKLLGLSNENEIGIKFELSLEPCDLIIATELIYTNDCCFKLFSDSIKRNPDAIRLFRTGEAISPDFNLFDYAIVFDRNLKNSRRVCRIPFNRFFSDSLIVSQRSIDYDAKISGGAKFCNFMYSNPNAHPNRDRLFFKISEYKKVDSIGRHLNNTNVKPNRYDADWRKSSIERRSEYKFSIAAENASFEGYVSEKLISCLQAGTVAIYWGDPSVKEDFNTDAFVNCHEYENIDAVVERIKEIDQDDELWLKIASTPWQTEEQIERMNAADKQYIDFLKFIFIDGERQRPDGTWPSFYENSFLKNHSGSKLQIKAVVKRVFHKVKRLLKND